MNKLSVALLCLLVTGCPDNRVSKKQYDKMVAAAETSQRQALEALDLADQALVEARKWKAKAEECQP